jgi:hypothetical protein
VTICRLIAAHSVTFGRVAAARDVIVKYLVQ